MTEIRKDGQTVRRLQARRAISRIGRQDVWRIGGLVCILALLSVTFASAGIEPTPFRSGLFGVATGQAIRISVFNAGDAGGAVNPCLRVWDAAGRLLFETNMGPVPGGAGAFADFIPLPDPPPAGGPAPAARVQLRVEVELEPNDGRVGLPAATATPVLARHIIPTIEVFDVATGRTSLMMPFVAVGFNPQPEPPTPTQ